MQFEDGERSGIREPEIQEDCIFDIICLFFQFLDLIPLLPYYSLGFIV